MSIFSEKVFKSVYEDIKKKVPPLFYIPFNGEGFKKYPSFNEMYYKHTARRLRWQIIEGTRNVNG